MADQAFGISVIRYGTTEQTGVYALRATVNELAARNVKAQGLRIHISYPDKERKDCAIRICNRMKQWARAEELHQMGGTRLGLEDICLNRNSLVGTVQVLVDAWGICVQDHASDNCETASGKSGMFGKCDPTCTTKNCERKAEGTDLLMVGYAGLEGSLLILAEKEEMFRKQYTASFLQQVRERERDLCDGRILKRVLHEEGIVCPEIRQVGQGGVFAELYRLTEERDCGLEVDLKKIPILQETVEICEAVRANPYQLTSAGAFLLMVKNGEKAVECLCEAGISASVIGGLTEGRDKILRNGEDIRYLDRPAEDELYRVFSACLE